MGYAVYSNRVPRILFLSGKNVRYGGRAFKVRGFSLTKGSKGVWDVCKTFRNAMGVGTVDIHVRVFGWLISSVKARAISYRTIASSARGGRFQPSTKVLGGAFVWGGDSFLDEATFL